MYVAGSLVARSVLSFSHNSGECLSGRHAKVSSPARLANDRVFQGRHPLMLSLKAC